MTQITTFQAPGKGVSFSWEAPDDSLLEDRRGVLPAFPSDVFSDGLSTWLPRASRGAGTLLDQVAIPMLGATSSLIGKARRVQAHPGWIQPMTLWTAVVGDSGDGKTPGLDVCRHALDRIQAENAPQYRDASIAHLTRIETARGVMKHWRKKCADAIADGKSAPEMPIEAVDPGDFIHPEIYVTDATVPRLARLCQIRPRGMLQVRNELSGLLCGPPVREGSIWKHGMAIGGFTSASPMIAASSSTICWSV
jgi:hypothetical protein